MKLLLIGAGNMGGAMLQGLHVKDVTVVVRNPLKAEALKQKYPTLKVVNEIPSLDDFLVIIAVKPQAFGKLVTTGKAKGVISVMAGISLAKLREEIAAEHYVRAMPNMAAMVQKSATSVCGDSAIKEEVLDVLSSIGKCFWLESEKELDIAAALAACSPAWMALVAESLSDGAVNLGLKRDMSYQFVAALFEGMGEVLKTEHPAVLKDQVMSPGGTTVAGYAKLEEGGVRDSFIKAMEASYERTKILGK
ncbi:MAG: pyrroline-5-carboxylate reductase [Sulfurospirillaceae bacterium]|nr:pyrroline-5-carboxylate reductase [Sulfurospirillaceae bacterium]